MSDPVWAAKVEGWNMSILGIFGKGPKMNITCGKCRRTWRERVPLADSPGLPCPSCCTVNILPIEVAG